MVLDLLLLLATVDTKIIGLRQEQITAQYLSGVWTFNEKMCLTGTASNLREIASITIFLTLV